MESENQGIKRQRSPRVLQSPNYDVFQEQILRAGHMRPEMGQNRRDHFPGHNLHLHSGPLPHPRPELYPHDMHEAIQREMEKRRIREEILMAEMARRRELEAEVRRELMMEGKLGLRIGIPFGVSPAVMGFDSPMTMRGLQITGLPLEKRIALSIEERARCESKRVETMPFQRANADLRISEVDPVLERGKEKKKIILLAKPEVNTSGSKRKAETPPVIDTNEPPPDLILKKKAKEEWTCTLCQISATSEQGLNEHLRGKKHNSKEVASRSNRTGKNYIIGLFPKKTTQSTQIESEPLKNESEVTEKVQKNGGPEEKKYKHWCEICRVGTYSRKVMNIHKKGKNHLKRLLNDKVKVEAVVNKVEEVDECGKDVISENVEETLDGAGSEHHEADDHPETDCGAGLVRTGPENEAQDLTKPEDDSTSVVVLDHAGDFAEGGIENVVDLDAVEWEYHVPENSTEAEDDVARDISKPEDVEEASPGNGTEAEGDVARDISKPDDVTGAEDDVALDISKPEDVEEASPGNGTGAEDDVALDISKAEDVEAPPPGNGTEVEDDEAPDISKPEDVEEASPENGTEAEDVARDISEPEAADELPKDGSK